MMTKKVFVTMLPATKELDRRYHTLWVDKTAQLVHTPIFDPTYKPQHLYFTTMDEITPSDKGVWFVIGDSEGGTDTIFGIDQYNGGEIPHGYAKIVATTNKELWYSNERTDRGKFEKLSFEEGMDKANFKATSVGRIPTDFIEAYVREQGRIKEVLLEYIEEEFNDPTGKYAELKLRPNGTVIIHPVKERMLSRDEVEGLCHAAFNRIITLPHDTIYWEEWKREILDKYYSQ
jgi:hypothetical protein